MAGNVEISGGSCNVEYTMPGRREGESAYQAKYRDDSKNVRVVCEGKVLYEKPLKQDHQVVVEWK